jgi:hypothetical protein
MALWVNTLDLVEHVAAMCRRYRSKSPSLSYAPTRLFPAPSQVYAQVAAAALLGAFLGYVYGMLSAKEVSSADPKVRYNPWPAVVSYAEYTLPVAGVAGFAVFAFCLTALRPRKVGKDHFAHEDYYFKLHRDTQGTYNTRESYMARA